MSRLSWNLEASTSWNPQVLFIQDCNGIALPLYIYIYFYLFIYFLIYMEYRYHRILYKYTNICTLRTRNVSRTTNCLCGLATELSAFPYTTISQLHKFLQNKRSVKSASQESRFKKVASKWAKSAATGFHYTHPLPNSETSIWRERCESDSICVYFN